MHVAWLLWVRIVKCLAQAHSSDNTGRFRESDQTIRNRRFSNIALRHRSRLPVCVSKAITVKHESPTFLKLRATSCVPIKRRATSLIQVCITHFWNKKFAQFTLHYFSISEDIDHANVIFRTGAGDLHDPCGRPGARGHHVGDPCRKVSCLGEHNTQGTSTPWVNKQANYRFCL